MNPAKYWGVCVCVLVCRTSVNVHTITHKEASWLRNLITTCVHFCKPRLCWKLNFTIGKKKSFCSDSAVLMCRVGLREKGKSLGSGQERFMFCFNTPGLIKKKKYPVLFPSTQLEIISMSHYKHSRETSRCLVENIQNCHVWKCWNAAVSCSAVFSSNFNSYHSFHTLTSKLMQM